MDRPRFRRPSRNLRPTLDGLERKALLSADQAAIASTALASEPTDVVPTSAPTAPDLVALAASSGPSEGSGTPESSGSSDPGPVLPINTSNPSDNPYVLAASSGGTSIPTDQIALDGTIRGSLRRYSGATTGAEPAFTLSGKGQHATIGRARVQGMAMPSSIESLPSATVTLRTRKGTITLSLTALPETSARPALAYRYTTESATGAYVGMSCTGTAQLGLPKGLPRNARGAAPFTLTLQSDHTMY